jgi:hypothetical protein
MKDNFSTFGRSGCKFYLDDAGIMLRKISSNINYNERLYSQYLKQNKFESIGNFCTPKSQNFDKLSELYTFDMEYIHGKTFESFCIDATISEIQAFSDSICQFISLNLKNSVVTEINFEKLRKKLYDLKSKLDNSAKTYIDYLLSNELHTLPIGKNHGDLTMSNIIFSDKYYLIDFLDNPYESPLNDLVKIKQDTEHNFYFDLIKTRNTKVKICLDYIDNELNNRFADIVCSFEFIWLSIFNLLRVLPYLTNENEKLSTLQNLKKYEYYITGGR